MSQAFISYHRAQRKLARLIAHRVAADGHAVWWDRGERPGDSWSEAVSTALANSACVIVIWSRQAATSPWVLGEATAGYGRGALISVLTDKTQPPSPFDRSPTIDMQGWEGESVDLAWIRLRDPVREKMTRAEKAAAIDAPLPPGRPAPVRVGFSSAAMAPPPPVYEERRGSSPISALVLLAMGGLGAAGWYYRDEVQDQVRLWRASVTPPPREYAAIPEPVAPVVPASVPAEAAPVAPAEIAEGPLEALPPEAAAIPASAAPPPVPAMTRTYEDWRDTFVPAPILRTLPRAAATEQATVAPVALEAEMETAPAAAVPAPVVSSRLSRLMVQEGRFIDVDGPGSRRQTDLWFAPDRTGYGLFLGVANGARMRVANSERATAKSCASGTLRRNPISARELQREGAICLRSTDGATSAWRVETIERGEEGSVLRLVAIGP